MLVEKEKLVECFPFTIHHHTRAERDGSDSRVRLSALRAPLDHFLSDGDGLLVPTWQKSCCRWNMECQLKVVMSHFTYIFSSFHNNNINKLSFRSPL